MPRIKIPIVAPPYPTVDGIELDTNTLSINDGYIDDAGFLVRRPGLSDYVDLGTAAPIDGLDYWEALDLLIAVSNRHVYSVDSVGGVTDLGLGLQLGNKPVFTFTKNAGSDWMAVANGGRIYLSENGGAISVISDADAPTSVSHVAFIRARLLANSVGTDFFYFSDFGDFTAWSALSFASAEGAPDDITALVPSWGEVILFGTQTIEFWYATGDGAAPYARLQGTQLDIGTISPDSIVYENDEGAYYFLDSERNVVKLFNKGTQPISKPIQRQLLAITDVTDARMDILKTSSKRFLVITFPTDDISYAMDLETGSWFQWGKWNTGTASYDAFPSRVSIWASNRGLNYGGSKTNDGQLYRISDDYYEDTVGEPIRTAVVTGWISVGTSTKKIMQCLEMRVKRSGPSDAGFVVLYRTDTRGSFSNERTQSINIGTSAYVPFIQRLHNFGMARAAQFEIYCTDAVPFIIGDFELEYKMTRN